MRKVELRAFHFEGVMIGDKPAKLIVGGTEYGLARHTPETMARHRAKNSALAQIPDGRITHFVENVRLPADALQLMFVVSDEAVEAGRQRPLLLTKMHVPQSARRLALENARRKNLPFIHRPHPKFLYYKLEKTIANDWNEIIAIDSVTDANDAALSAIVLHPEIICLDSGTMANVQNIATYATGFSALAKAINDNAGRSKTAWAPQTSYQDVNGNSLTPSTNFPTTTQYTWCSAVQTAMQTPLAATIRAAKAASDLQATATNPGIYTIVNGIVSANATPASGLTDGSATTLAALSLTPTYKLSVNSATITNNNFSTSVSNSALHCLTAFAQFLDDQGNVMAPAADWVSPGVAALNVTSENLYQLAMVPSVPTTLGIPDTPNPVSFNFSWPSNNPSSVRLVFGGLGANNNVSAPNGTVYCGWDFDRCIVGTLATVVFNFAIPMVCLVNGVPCPASVVQDLMSDVLDGLVDAYNSLTGSSSAKELAGGDTSVLLSIGAAVLVALVTSTAAVSSWFTKQIGEGALAKSIPVLGWIFTAASVVIDAALVAEAGSDFFESPSTYETEFDRPVEVSWEVGPDEDAQVWPPQATHWVATADIDGGTTRMLTGAMPDDNTDTVSVEFTSETDPIPYGAEATFSFAIFSANGFSLGAVTTTPQVLAPEEGDTYEVEESEITEIPVPITAETIFQFEGALDLEAGNYSWDGADPQATIANLSTAGTGQNLGGVLGIGVNNPTVEIVYAWQASGQSYGGTPASGQTFSVQAVSKKSDAGDGLIVPPSPLTASTLIAIDGDADAGEEGAHFYLDCSNPNTPILRTLIVNEAPGTFSYGGDAWGAFQTTVNDIAICSGVVAGVETANSRLEILQLPSAGVSPDSAAPIAIANCGYGARTGLLHGPVAVAALGSGSGFAVLESADASLSDSARIQVFDTSGNPAPIYPGNMNYFYLSSPQIDLPTTLLDLEMDDNNYAYVLKYVNDGTQVNDYYMDVYDDQGNFLTQQGGVAGGKLALDDWRTAWVLSYATIGGPGASTQPAISEWAPSTPSAAGRHE